MVTVTGYTASRMKQIEDESIIDGYVSGDNLYLKARDETVIDAGNVRGPQGDKGDRGDDADFGGYFEPMLEIANASGTVTLDLEAYNNWYLDPSGQVTIDVIGGPTDLTSVKSGTLFITNSDHPIIWPGSAKFPYGTPPELDGFCVLALIITYNELIILTNVYEVL